MYRYIIPVIVVLACAFIALGWTAKDYNEWIRGKKG